MKIEHFLLAGIVAALASMLASTGVQATPPDPLPAASEALESASPPHGELVANPAQWWDRVKEELFADIELSEAQRTQIDAIMEKGAHDRARFKEAGAGLAQARLEGSAERVEARECERLGLVNRVVPDADLEKDALAWAKQIAAGPPVALRYMKDNLNRALQHDLRACLDMEAERMVQGAMTEDYLEAVAAFQEKRAPIFKGR